MSYFLLLKPFHMVLSGMALLDGEDSPHSHETDRKITPGQDRGQAGKSRKPVLRPAALGALTGPHHCFCTATVLGGRGTAWFQTRFHPVLHAFGGLVFAYSVSAFRDVTGSVGTHVDK